MSSIPMEQAADKPAGSQSIPTAPKEHASERTIRTPIDLAADNPAVAVPASHSLPNSPIHRLARTIKGLKHDPLHPGHAEDDVSSQALPSTARTSPGHSEEHLIDKYQTGWRRIVRNFTPSWFSVTTGTGAVSAICIAIPFKSDWLYWIAVIFFVLNAILFLTAFTISFLRYTLYPEIWHVMLHDPHNSLFLGTIPMGFATLVQAWVVLCSPHWGQWSVYVAWGAWMLNVVNSLVITAGLSYVLISQPEIKSLDRITAVQLLPIAATIVAAGSGVPIAVALNNPDHAMATLLVSYVLWGMAVPLSFMILVIYYSRLVVHKLPPREVIVSSFLPLGPLGTGGYTILELGKASRDTLPKIQLLSHVTLAGDILYILGLLVALIMWAFALTWLILALLTIQSSRPFPFNMGWWGFTFPLGVFAISTITIGNELPSHFFQVLGTIFGVAVIMLWIVVAVGTIQGARTGKLFYAPCLKKLPKHQQEKTVKV